jgi:hypothetical protein
MSVVRRITALFTMAIGLHFVLSDRGLGEHYGDRFDQRWPRLSLAGALLAGGRSPRSSRRPARWW